MNTEQKKAFARVCEVSAFGQFATVGYSAYQTHDWLILASSFALFVILIIIEYVILGINFDQEEQK